MLVIFDTLFSGKCPFLGNFDKNLFLPPSSTQITKSGSKFNLELFLELFCPYVLMMGAKTGFCQICPKNGHFPLNQVSKITNQTNQQIKNQTTKKFQKTENAQNT